MNMVHLRRFGAACALLASGLVAQAARHAVIIDVDGVRRDTVQQLYESGRLPNFQRIFANARWFDRASTVLPSVTMPAQAALFTGVLPARHDIPGNQWFDREEGRLYDYVSPSGLACTYGFATVVGMRCAGGLGNLHLRAPTVYEAATRAGLTSTVVYSQYWKGATQPLPPTEPEALLFIRGNTIDWPSFDREMAARAIAGLRARGVPSILTVYFAGSDTAGHKQGVVAQVAYLTNIIDPLLGRILDTYQALDPEWAADTMFVMTSDHGRTEVQAHPEDLTLAADLLAALPAHSQIAKNGGMGFVYLEHPEQEDLTKLAATLAAASPAVALVRARSSEDCARAGDLIVVLRVGHYFDNSGAGSQHGSPYHDDLEIPMVVSAPGVEGGHTDVPVRITQVAGTIAGYLGFPMDSAAPSLPLR
jgi:predicted AlkP superfamily pyrophosphatase or phosphodiesterase